MKWRSAVIKTSRLLYRSSVKGTPLAACWQHEIASTRTDWRNADFLVCDAEMTSLDANTGELLSLGWIAIADGMIQLNSAAHHLILPDGSVGQSATIHHLRDIDLNDARPLEEVMALFLLAAAGRVLVFHNAALDIAYIDSAVRALHGAPLLLPYADTMLAEHALLTRRGSPIGDGNLRLDACRARYGLTRSDAHNALCDALATAELFLAQNTHRSGQGKLDVGSLLS